jgi:hypothetical protein
MGAGHDAGIALTVARDNHGPPLLVGFAVGALLLWPPATSRLVRKRLRKPVAVGHQPPGP